MVKKMLLVFGLMFFIGCGINNTENYNVTIDNNNREWIDITINDNYFERLPIDNIITFEMKGNLKLVYPLNGRNVNKIYNINKDTTFNY